GVPTSWLQKHECTAEDVVMLRYDGTAWETLKTTALGEEYGQALFSAETDGFSTFAIAVGTTASAAHGAGENVTPTVTQTVTVTEPEETATPAQTPTQKAPLPLWPALVAAGAAALLARKH
ncbi:MAG: PGF-pre-PGF domain-containing protein, partial [Methanofollis sp.]|nr:PGF-pre-PGF domain-containing protein [Methanofollis sp.]